MLINWLNIYRCYYNCLNMTINSDVLNFMVIMIVPTLAILIGLLAVYFEHKEKMKMIEKGLVPEKAKYKVSEKFNNWHVLAIGLIITAVGSGRVLSAYLQGEVAGFTLLFIGLAIVIYFVTKRKFFG